MQTHMHACIHATRAHLLLITKGTQHACSEWDRAYIIEAYKTVF